MITEMTNITVTQGIISDANSPNIEPKEAIDYSKLFCGEVKISLCEKKRKNGKTKSTA